MAQLALTRLVEMAGEATVRISAATQQLNPKYPWPQIIGMSNRLVHGYDPINLDLLWDTITHELPQLIALLEALIERP